MDLGDITKIMEDKNASNIRIPDLDWLVLNPDNTKNIPTPHNVEIIPQLQETWGNTDASSARLINNKIRSEVTASDKISSEDISDVVNTAKKEMMLGLNGKSLARKLASTYPRNLIKAAKKDLIKLAEEQGLLGNVYVDLSPFDSCEHAAHVLGKNKIRLAKYVVNKPKRNVCSSHHTGYCKSLGKNVLDNMDYNTALLGEYTKHLKVAGILTANESVDSKKTLREALLNSSTVREANFKDTIPIVEEERPREFQASLEDLKSTLIKEAEEEINPVSDFEEMRPVLAFIQNEMLKGKLGNNLKEAISHKITESTIKKFAKEIKKAVSLQGLLGNVYVDVSYFDNANDAINSIKNASTSPSYLIQSNKKNEYDNTLEKVAAATGCELLPRNGKIKEKVASSYIDDLQFNSRISSDTAENARNRIEAGDNVLGIIRDIYMNSLSYTPTRKEGGQPGYFHQSVSKKYASRDKLKDAAYKAVEAGFPLEKIEEKLAQEIPTTEAVGLLRNVIAAVKEVDANVLTRCTKEKYQFSRDARLKKASKCNTCIRATCVGCTALGLKFANADIDPKTEKVLFNENPDIITMNKEYDMPEYRGGNMNVQLEKMRTQEASEINTDYNMAGMDQNLSDI